MGQSSSCQHWFSDGGDAHGAAQVDEAAPVNFPPASSTTGANGPKTQYRPSRDMRAALKAQESKKASQERWHKTKAEWQASVEAELEERERHSQSPAPEPGSDCDRLRALQMIREEVAEEQRQRTDSQENADKGLQSSPAGPEAAKEAPALQETPAPETAKESLQETPAPEIVKSKACDGQEQEGKEVPSQKPEQTLEQQEHAAGGDKENEKPQSAEEAAAHKAIVDAFLAKNGFDGVAAKKKRTLRPSIYALHLAAEMGDANIISLLLEAGADASQKDSSGRTPSDIAKKKNRKGSHDEALTALKAF